MTNTLEFEVIISYDIEDNKSRTKLFDALKDFGLKPIQKSVFWGILINAEYREIKSLIEDYLQPEDKAFIAKTNTQNSKQFIAYNYLEDDFKVKKSEAI
jgi:CRISPR-associated protein Cas2